MKLSRDSWLAIGVVSILVIVTIAASIQQAPTIAYLSTSSKADGTLALKLWLQSVGYSPLDDVDSEAYLPPPNADLVLILQPIVGITDQEWPNLDALVDHGASLLLAGDSVQALQAMSHYGFTPELLDQETTVLSLQNPLMTSPAMESPIPIQSDIGLVPPSSPFITHLAAGGHPVLVSFEKGSGRVILSATAMPFSNIALKNPATASLVLNLVALSPHRRTVWFDEWHHGIRAAATPIVGPDQWLRRTPVGHALLFAVVALFLALLMQGRAFGRPVPLPSDIKRRGPLEHVTAIANLSRRAGHRQAIARQYYGRLKRHLARRYSLDPSLPDAQYVKLLAGYNPNIHAESLLRLLQGLSRKNVSEDDLIRLAAQASEWMKNAE